MKFQVYKGEEAKLVLETDSSEEAAGVFAGTAISTAKELHIATEIMFAVMEVTNPLDEEALGFFVNNEDPDNIIFLALMKGMTMDEWLKLGPTPSDIIYPGRRLT
jgi:hypothetical protein